MTTKSALGRLALVTVPVLSLLGPRTYACEFHPLARLAGTVEEGMQVETVLARFESYASRSGPDDGGDAVLGDVTPRQAGRARPARRILFIHDLWLEEDLELTAWFDSGGTLMGTRFSCTP